MTRLLVRHETVYEYGDPVVTSHNEAHLRPRRLHRQTVARTLLSVDPNPDTLVWRKDYFGNDVVFFNLNQSHDRLRLISTGEVEVAVAPELDPSGTPAWEEIAGNVRLDRASPYLDAFQFVFDSSSVRRSDTLARYASSSFLPGRPVLDAVLALNRRIHRDFEYDQGATQVSTPLEEAMERRRGVCQDFAHVMIGCLRSLGVPARYVSGYVRASVGGEEEVLGAHASHAWVSVLCGRDAGWIDLDPTNDRLVSDHHVVLGWGRDYDDVTPMKGVTLGGTEHAVSVRVEVKPLS